MPKLLAQLNYTKIAKITLVIFVIEALSLMSFKVTWLSGLFFILLASVIICFTLYKLEYGLYFAISELMIGSYGYLFYLQLPGFKMPIRLGIFLIIFFIWLFKYFKLSKIITALKKDRLTQTLAVFMLFLLIGVINGYLHKNNLANIFFDFNGYLYFGLYFAFIYLGQIKNSAISFLRIFIACLIYLSLKVFITLYIFTHGFVWLSDLFYTWIRDTRVGEITWAGGAFFRIFIQSQMYSLIGVFVIAILLNQVIKNQKNLQAIFKNRQFQYLYGLLIILQTSILISFSRSFWLGGFSSGLVFLIYIIVTDRKEIKKICRNIAVFILAGIASLILMITIVNFPLPKPAGIFSADMLKNRFTASDEAASSRWNLLPVLFQKNLQTPFFGTGFGTSVTYQTNDPRIKNEGNPQGWYTTFTFEWGYLDTITEIGILGLVTYLALIIQIGWRGIKLSFNTEDEPAKLLARGFLLGLIALLITNAFSPYLNHPLGIGYLLILIAFFTKTDPTAKPLTKRLN